MSSSQMDWGELANSVRIPNQHDKVYNEECVFSFDTPDSPDGLYVCLERFLAFGKEHVTGYHGRTSNSVFLHRKRTKMPKEAAAAGEQEVPEKVSRMAIGVPGGFNPDEKNYDVQEVTALVVLPSFTRFSLEDEGVPLAFRMSAKAILNADSAVKMAELEAAAGTWDGEKILPSKHAEDLTQLNNDKKIPPRGWKCEMCDLTNNLWLNLTDGSVLCGRKFFNGSGGNDHAVEHFKENKYPLAVKLGTITPDGRADVFSYSEDSMVEDPLLAKHLAHFGINISTLSKTDKSMAEIEIDMNQRIGEWAMLTESDQKLVPIYGKGYTGMQNLGNTCYMNSVMQVLFTMSPFIEYYCSKADQTFRNANFDNPMKDFKLQMSKLGHSLWSGKYSEPPKDGQPEEQQGIKPAVFKTLIGTGHAEFATKQQQDAQEFYLHLCTLMEREHPREENPARCLQFEVEDRIECGSTGKVRYLTRTEDYFPLPIPLSEATNKAEVTAWEQQKAQMEAKGENVSDREKVRPVIPFQACLRSFREEEQVPDFFSSATKEKTFAKKRMRFKTFPDYLIIQLKKFDVDASWVPYKLDVEVEMPDEIDLGCLRGTGLQSGEEELPADDDQDDSHKEEPVPVVIPDASIVEHLLEMGFNANGCKKAAVNTKNAGTEAAVNWVMAHMLDADFSEPFVQPDSAPPRFVPDPEGLESLKGMGLAEMKCIKALRETDNNVERAVDWIFSHPDDDGAEASASTTSDSSKGTRCLTDGVPKYALSAFISHMGQSTMVGHYVCHILKEGKWIIFNDDKVAQSEKPPKGLGYLYLYTRKDYADT